MPRSTGYVTLNVTPAAREAVRRLSYALTGASGRRVSLSDAVLAAVAMADTDHAATAHHLPADTTDPGGTTDD